jgi:hypothetical protein
MKRKVAHRESALRTNPKAASISRMGVNVIMPPNDPSSATRRTGRNDCNRDAPAGFAAAHG